MRLGMPFIQPPAEENEQVIHFQVINEYFGHAWPLFYLIKGCMHDNYTLRNNYNVQRILSH